MKNKDVPQVSIADLQAYLAGHYGGWANEQGLFMKLVEEMGEVAEVLNKRSKRKAAGDEDLPAQLGEELADMIHYIVAIAAINDIDLAGTILEKDRRAAVKYNHAVDLLTFLSDR